MPRVDSVGLVGTGMIGSSLLLALREADWLGRAIGFDAVPSAARAAQVMGAIDEVACSLYDLASRCDLVIVAVPVRSVALVCQALGKGLGAGTVVTDVGSVKQEVIDQVTRWLPFPDQYVAGHPVAGTERSGPEAASSSLFANRRVVLTPAAETRSDALSLVQDMWQAVGAQVYRMLPRLHDQIFSLVSHLPHVSAFALAATAARVCRQQPELAARVPGFFGAGFVDTTRVAASNIAMWRDILLANADAVREHISVLATCLVEFDQTLERGDAEGISQLIAEAHQGRQHILAEK